jgi:predicted DNA binding CopG/RHH family protein
MNQLGKIRRLYYREGLSISEVSRRSGLTRNTVKRWLKAGEGVEPKYRMRLPAALLDAVKAKAAMKGIPYSRYVRMLLETDAMSPAG